VEAVGLVVDFHGRQLRERLYLHTGGRTTGVLKLLTDGSPVEPTLNRFVPPTYSAVMTLALKDVGLWERLQQLITETQGPAAAGNLDMMAQHVQQQFGIRVREGLLDALTDEVCLAVDLTKVPEFAGAGRQPKPQEIPFLLAAEMKNEAALTGTLDRVAANERLWEMGVERASRKHGDVDIFTFRVPFRSDLRPSYAMVDETFLFSLRAEAIRAALDARKTKKSFATAPAVRRVGGPAHLRLQLQDSQLLTTLLAMIRAGVPEGAQRLVPELERILGGLHGHATVVRREEQGISVMAESDLGSAGTFVLAAVFLDQFNAIVAKRVYADFDHIGSALEGYRKEHGAYPEALNALVPRFLPEIPRDRFQPKRAYGYSRGAPGLGGKLPRAWCLTSVGPDKKVDIPVEQFDPQVWHRRATAPEPDEVLGLKQVVYQFQPGRFKDETKNDDEGDLIRMGGPGLTGKETATVPRPAQTPRAKPPTAPPDF
ncbi:MAG: hypothetical protein ACODAJ_13525, partial [Planctomycetota bacterium]